MKYRNGIIALGVLVVINKFLYFPSTWTSAIYMISGLVISILAYMSGKNGTSETKE